MLILTTRFGNRVELIAQPEQAPPAQGGDKVTGLRSARVSWSFAVSRFTKRVALPAGRTEPTQGRGGPSGSIPLVRSVGQVVHPIEP